MFKVRLLATTLLAASAIQHRAIAQDSEHAVPGMPSPAQVEKDRILRTVRLGEREITLPKELDTAKLRVANDLLERDIARRDGEASDPDRLEIDQFEVTQREAAIAVAKVFAQVWLKGGDVAAQGHLEAAEKSFDESNDKCLARDENHEPIVFSSVEEAQAACHDLHTSYLETQKLHLAPPGSWHSVFQDDPGSKARLGYSFLVEDTEHLRRDKAAGFTAKDRKWLVQQDESLIDTDKQIWLEEIDIQETKELNAKYPDEPLDTIDEVFQHEKSFRQDIATTVEKYRSALHSSHSKAPARRTGR